ncbi:type 2 lantibiotic biosynthesis protein LanM [Thiorhodovibrio winogradskyi]|uniref:Type 2 lantibiotic biosynthesis protein LanM n=1 Tax=Thiorhodovibrio winogradskyi TaxID=77007 RepID=A0ABZ0S7M3_9GAMM|nr:DUF4135 domain-containing protein [Thiorhodovibrio winogradskyi]
MTQVKPDNHPRSPARSVLFTDAELRLIAGRASLPEERAAACWIADPDAGPDGDADSRLGRWRQAVAKGNDAVFRRVLDWRGIDWQARAARLAPVRLAPDAPLPEWIHRFLDLVETSGAAWAGTPTATAETLAAHAMRKLEAPAAAGFSAEALAGLQGRCAELVAGLLGPAAQSIQPRPGAEGVAAFFRRCPVLARLLVKALDDWTNATTEMMERLAADRRDILRELLGGLDPGAVTDISDENADPHEGGRRVLLLRFEHGQRIVYKPRSLAVDLAFARLVAWLARREPDFNIKTPGVIDRDEYGWCAFIEHRCATDDAEEQAFYRHAGQLIALAHALDASDLHYENLIADGPWPVPIDLETALVPRLDGPAITGPAPSAVARAQYLMAFGVLHTCLLPVWNRSAKTLVDFGGLGDQTTPSEVPKHRPSNGPIEPILARHAPLISAGFVASYRLILAHRDALLAEAGPLAGLRGAPLRFIFRDTAIYTRLLHRSLAADLTGDAAERALALEQLARVLCLYQERPPHASLVDAEIRALTALDIPRFQIPADGRRLFDQRAPLGEVPIAATAHEGAQARLRSLSPTDLERQERVLRGALRARLAATRDLLPPRPLAEAPPPSARERIAAATRLAEQLVSQAIFDDGDELAWISLRHLPQEDAFQLAGGDVSLGYGNAGQGLLFATLHGVAPGDGWDARCRAALRPLLAGLDATAPAEHYRRVRPDLGLYTGVSGITLALLLAAVRIGWEEASEAAARLADRHLVEESLRDAEELSVHGGLAGAVVALLAMDEMSPGRGWLERAVVAGSRLATGATPAALGGLANGRCALGPIHGPTGVALAALGLLARNGDGAWGDLARRAMASAPASPKSTDAPDWRLAGGGGDLAVRAFAQVLGVLPPGSSALPAAARSDLATLSDSALHGRAGAVEVLDLVSDDLDRPDPRQLAEEVRADLVQGVRDGCLRYFRHDIPGDCPATLCHGSTGIALALLRGLADGPQSLLFPRMPSAVGVRSGA